MRLPAPVDQLASRTREENHAPVLIPALRSYGSDVVADPEVRLARFTDFVRRAIRDSGMSVEDLAHKAGIGVNTLYLWRSGSQWRDFPNGENVRKFCAATGRKVSEAQRILWPDDDEAPAEPEPLDIPTDMRELIRELRSDAVPVERKHMIVAMIAYLARQGRRGQGGEDNGGTNHASAS